MLQKEKPYVIQWKYGEDDGGGCSYKVGDGYEVRIVKTLGSEEFPNSFIDNESVHTIHIYIHK